MATHAKTATSKRAAPKNQGDWSVIDINVLNPKCSTPTRQHDAIDADGSVHVYELPGVLDKLTKAGCPMPPDHAIQFLKDPAFKVYDADGKLVQPLKPQTSTQGISLQRHETVATFQELTRDALMNRARRLPGGQLLPLNTTSAKLIELLMTGGAPNTQRVEPGEDLGSVDGEGDDDTEIDPEGDLGGELPEGLAARKAEIMAQIGRGAAPAAAHVPHVDLADVSLG